MIFFIKSLFISFRYEIYFFYIVIVIIVIIIIIIIIIIITNFIFIIISINFAFTQRWRLHFHLCWFVCLFEFGNLTDKRVNGFSWNVLDISGIMAPGIFWKLWCPWRRGV